MTARYDPDDQHDRSFGEDEVTAGSPQNPAGAWPCSRAARLWSRVLARATASGHWPTATGHVWPTPLPKCPTRLSTQPSKRHLHKPRSTLCWLAMSVRADVVFCGGGRCGDLGCCHPRRSCTVTLRAIVGDRFDGVVIDTPSLDHDRSIVVSALRVATHVVIPLAPTAIEYHRLATTVDAINGARDLRPDEGPEVAILLTRAISNAASHGRLSNRSPRGRTPGAQSRHRPPAALAHAYARPLERESASAYGDALEQLLADEAIAP